MGHLGEKSKILPAGINVSLRRFQQPVQMLDKGGFAGAGMPDHPEEFPGRTSKSICSMALR